MGLFYRANLKHRIVRFGIGLLVVSMVIQCFGLVVPANAAGLSQAVKPEAALLNQSLAPDPGFDANVQDRYAQNPRAIASSQIDEKAEIAKAKANPAITPSGTIGSGISSSLVDKGTRSKPNLLVAVSTVIYANKGADDNISPPADCTTVGNADCSLRSALKVAVADSGRSSSTPDLIVLKSITYNLTLGTLNVADYVYISTTSDMSCLSYSSVALISGSGNVSGSDIFSLGSGDYLNSMHLISSRSDGIEINGSSNKINCVIVQLSLGNGIAINAGSNNNQIGGILGNGSDNPSATAAGKAFGVGGQEVVLANNSAMGLLIQGTSSINTDHNIILNTGVGICGVCGSTGNGFSGIYIFTNVSNTIIGSSLVTQTNVISLNGNNFPTVAGIVLDANGSSLTNTQIIGNLIGTDATGNAEARNYGVGIRIRNGATGNIIKGNVISGNGFSGITLGYSGTNNNVIQGNMIGVKKDLSGPLYNGTSGPGSAGTGTNSTNCNPGLAGSTPDSLSEDCAGIFLFGNSSGGPSANQIGGHSSSAQGNIIAASQTSHQTGIFLDYASGNFIQGNAIGSNFTASAGYPTFTGIALINGSSNNLLGGDSVAGEGNQIGGFNYDGISVFSRSFSSSATVYGPVKNNKVQGNAIGVDFSGATLPALTPVGGPGGGAYGIDLYDTGSQPINSNLIGVDYSVPTPNKGQANILGNLRLGILLAGLNADSNQVNGNLLGINSSLTTSTSGNGSGISLSGNVTNSQIQGNYIGSANLAAATNSIGLSMYSGANNNLVTKNFIGTNASGANFHNNLGIYLSKSGTTGPALNTFSQNIIGNNLNDGIKVGSDNTDSLSQRNTFSQNSIFNNGGLGINLNYAAANPTGVNGGADTGPNNQAQIPTISAATVGNIVQATGTANPNSIVEIFLVDSSNTQGQTYLGSGTANASGNFVVNASVPSNVVISATSPKVIATSTLKDPAFPVRVGSTSQFSSPVTAVTKYLYNLPLLANNASTAVGQTTTYITFQNLSSSSTANVGVQYYGISSGVAGPSDSLTIPAKGQKAILPGIPAGSSYGGVVTSDQPLNLVVSEALNAGGSAYNVAASTASTLYSPLALNGQYGFNTSIIVFNAGESGTSTGTIKFYDESGNPSGTTQNFSVPAHASQIFKQSDAGSGLASNHAYWAKITAANSSDNLTAQVIEFGPSNFVATFNAIVPAQVQSTLYAPATFNGQFGFVTGMELANPSGSSANVTINYYDSAGNLLLAQSGLSIPANGTIGIFQPGVAGLQNTVSSATIVGTQPLIMTVNERGPGSVSGTYVGIAGGVTNVALPVMANGFAGFITGATVLNVGSSPANLSFTYLDATGTQVGTTQTQTIAPNASYLVYQGAPSQGLPGNFFGTALITSNQPLLVTTNALNTTTGLFYTYTEPSK